MNVTEKIWELNKLIKDATPPQRKLMTLEKYRLIKRAEAEGFQVNTEDDGMQTIYHLCWEGVEVIHTRIPNNILEEIEKNLEEIKKIKGEDTHGLVAHTDPTSAAMDKMWRDLGMSD